MPAPVFIARSQLGMTDAEAEAQFNAESAATGSDSARLLAQAQGRQQTPTTSTPTPATPWLPPVAAFMPVNSKQPKGPSMWASMFTSVLGQGAQGSSLFAQTAGGLMQADYARAEAKRSRNMLILGGTAAVGVGLLAWALLRK